MSLSKLIQQINVVHIARLIRDGSTKMIWTEYVMLGRVKTKNKCNITI